MSGQQQIPVAQASQAPSGESLAHPPKTRLAFRIGVVGHRPNRLQKANPGDLKALLKSLLQEVRKTVSDFPGSQPSHRNLYLPDPPVFRAVSPLAEGTDRIFAEVALDLGFELCCPMPFQQAEFEEDFKPPNALEAQSLECFRGLLGRAASETRLVRFELDGVRSQLAEAYGAAGRVVMNQSDLLVVVWDGEPAAGGGGTVQTMQEALSYHIPVVWVDAWAPHPWQLLRNAADLDCLIAGQRCVPASRSGEALEELRNVVTDALAPHLEPGRKRSDLREAFFQERRPRLNPFVVWKLFRDLVGANRLSIPSMRAPDFEKAVERDWPCDGGGVTRWVNSRLRPHYAWADKLADLYADAYRSSFLLAYGLGVLAVFLALMPVLSLESHSGDAFSIGAELVVVIGIIALIVLGNRGRWHERWMDYRLTAELVRQLRFLIPLGGGRPFPRLPAHLRASGNPSETWMYWHVRALEREVGLPDTVITGKYLTECRDYVLQVVVGQRDFHRDNRLRANRIDERLHFAALALFGLTAGAVFVHFLPHLPGASSLGSIKELAPYFTIACAVLPALGGALTAINNQGEFARIAKRSRAMDERLESIRARLRPEGSGALRLTQLIEMATTVARLMVDEMLDWRVLFQDRPLVPPG